jgi:MoaA/NifB/PqqE/SkfB family radical SAM enzyme
MAGDQETGWGVARNLLKPLNHLDFLRRQEEIAVKLNLHNTLTPQDVFDLNYGLLQKHQQRQLTTDAFLEHLAGQLSLEGRRTATDEIRPLLRQYATVRHMEFHPSDVCNLTCRGCTYGHDDPATKPAPVNFPLREIGRMALLKPRSMVIIGGGEPALYRQGKYGFQELIDEITEQCPGIALALTTNGTFKPPGDWPNKFDWLRLSLDAATPGTYRRFRGKALFHKVVKNFLDYLDYAVPFVGLSFLFARSNVHEYAAVANFVYHLVKREKPHHLGKVNIQYRPLRRDPHDYRESFKEAISDQQRDRAAREVRALWQNSRGVRDFIKNQTNITAILGGNSHPAYDFSRCFYSQTFKIVRANGDLRPCFIRVVEPDFILGNIIDDPLETITLNTLYVGAIRKPDCDSEGCRQCHVNYVFEQGLKGALQPSSSPAVLADPMY